MARYKPVFRGMKMIPLALEDQIQEGTFEFALNQLIEEELDLSALDAKYKNDETGATAYDPRVMLKIVLLGYSRGLISSRAIEKACEQNVLFMAMSGDVRPSYTHIAKFVRELKDDIQPLFTQVLLTCDQLGLIGKEHFAIDGVKLPANASKERSGTHAELLHLADRLDKASGRMLQTHQDKDEGKGEQDLDAKRQKQAERVRRKAQTIREFVAKNKPRLNAKGKELKGNVTDNDSAKMATSKGVIQGYAAQAAVDGKHQVIVAAEVLGSGSEQAALIPMVEKAQPFATDQTLFTADAGYHSEENLKALQDKNVPAMIADGQMRKRDERFARQDKHRSKPDPLADKGKTAEDALPKKFRPSDFEFDPEGLFCICPANRVLYGNGKLYEANGWQHQKFAGQPADCGPCKLREQCIRTPEKTEVRKVAFFPKDQASPMKATELMRTAIDSPQGRRLYSQRIATVEPVFANLRHNKRLTRFTLRGQCKVNTQWNLYCLVHNIEKMAGKLL